MLPALRAVRTHHPPLVSLPLTTSLGRKTLSVRYQRAKSMSTQPDKQDNMDETHEHHEKTEDIITESFGVEYATRSEEEGFGGTIYGGDQTKTKTNKEEEVVQENHHPEHDKKQGSEVSQK